MKANLKYVFYCVTALIIFFTLLNQCSGNDDDSPSDNRGGDSIKTDTIYIRKVIKGKTIKVKDTILKPVYVENEVNKDLQDEVNRLKNDNERIAFLLEKLKTRVYDTTYNIKDKGSLTIKDSVQGELLGREWSFKFDDIVYEETHTTTTVKKYPNFVISLGVDSGLSTDFSVFEKPFVGGVVGFKNKKGYELVLGYNTLEQFKIQLKKDIFTHYKN